MSVDVRPGTIVLFSDIGCPWSSLAVRQLRRRRGELGLDGRVRLVHRVFPLELVNGRPTPKPTLDAEVEALGGLVPDLAWRAWSRPEYEYPGSLLLPLEAVQAARDGEVGGPAASEDLDAALRDAFYRDSRPIGQYAEVLAVAEAVPSVHAGALDERLRDGRARRVLFADWALSARVARGSSHVFLPDGGDVHNPGVTMHVERGPGGERPVVDAYEPAVYDELLRRATGERRDLE